MNRPNRRPSFSALGLALLLSLFAATSPAQAQSISADRPGFGDGAAPVSQGVFQAELGYQFTRASTNLNVVQADRLIRVDVDETQHAIGQVLLRYGATDALELRGGIGSFSIVTAEGEGRVQTIDGTITTEIDDKESGYIGAGVGPQPGATLGAKARFFQSATATLSALATTSLPLADDDFSGGDDRARQELKLALNGALGSNITLSVNGGASFFWASGTQDDRAPVWLLTPSVSFGISDQVGAYVGYAGFYDDGPNENYVEGGVTLLPTANVQVDVNTGLRIDDNIDSLLFVGLGLAHRF